MKKVLLLMFFLFIISGCATNKENTNIIFENEYLEVKLTDNGSIVENDQIAFKIEAYNKSNHPVKVNGQTLPISGKIEYTNTIDQSVVEEKNGHYIYYQSNFYSYDDNGSNQEKVNLEIELNPNCFK